jgi:hypothetical protein
MSNKNKKPKVKPYRVRWDRPSPKGENVPVPEILYFPETKVTIHTKNPEQYHRFYDKGTK